MGSNTPKSWTWLSDSTTKRSKEINNWWKKNRLPGGALVYSLFISSMTAAPSWARNSSLPFRFDTWLVTCSTSSSHLQGCWFCLSLLHLFPKVCTPWMGSFPLCPGELTSHSLSLLSGEASGNPSFPVHTSSDFQWPTRRNPYPKGSLLWKAQLTPPGSSPSSPFLPFPAHGSSFRLCTKHNLLVLPQFQASEWTTASAEYPPPTLSSAPSPICSSPTQDSEPSSGSLPLCWRLFSGWLFPFLGKQTFLFTPVSHLDPLQLVSDTFSPTVSSSRVQIVSYSSIWRTINTLINTNWIISRRRKKEGMRKRKKERGKEMKGQGRQEMEKEAFPL